MNVTEVFKRGRKQAKDRGTTKGEKTKKEGKREGGGGSRHKKLVQDGKKECLQEEQKWPEDTINREGNNTELSLGPEGTGCPTTGNGSAVYG